MEFFSIKILIFFVGGFFTYKVAKEYLGLPTIGCLFAGILYGGIILNKSLLRYLLGAALKLQDEGWDILTKRWIGFFIALAILNEIIWRTQTTDIWVNFKVFGILPITFVFTLTQFSTIKKYQIED